MRCPDCNKFVSFDEQDPEVNDISIDEDGHITASVRIVNACQECGNELKEATFDFDEDIDVEEHKGKGHDLDITDDGCERTSRSGYFDKKKGFVPSVGRYAKMFYGASLEYTVNCSCGGFDYNGTFEDDVQASGMDELV